MEQEKIVLPDNAFRELREGEKYEPVMSPRKTYAEVNIWSVTWGVLMAMLFSAAAAYLGLKVRTDSTRMSSYRVSELVRVPWWRELSSPCLPFISYRLNIPR